MSLPYTVGNTVSAAASQRDEFVRLENHSLPTFDHLSSNSYDRTNNGGQ